MTLADDILENAMARESAFNAGITRTLTSKGLGTGGLKFLPSQTLANTMKLRDVSLPLQNQALAKALHSELYGGSKSTGATQFKTLADQLESQGVSPAVAKAAQQLSESKRRASVGGGLPGPSILTRLSHAAETGAKPLLNVANRGFDLWSRPGYAVQSAIKGGIHQVKKDAEKFSEHPTLGGGVRSAFDVSAGLAFHPKELWKGFSGKDKSGGGGILSELGWKTTGKNEWYNRLAHGTTGMATSLATDPTSYFSLGIVAALKKAAGIGLAEVTAKELEQSVAKQLANKGLSLAQQKTISKTVADAARVTRGGPTKGVKKFSEDDQAAVTNKVLAQLHNREVNAFEQNAKRVAQGQRKLPSQMGKEYDAAKKAALAAGKTPAAADSIARQAAYSKLNQMENDLSTAVTGALQDSGLKHNRLALRVGFMGNGPDVLQNVKWAEKAYRPIEWTGEQLGRTGVGDAFTNAFKYEKYFPGRASYLREVSQSLGVEKQKEWADRVKKSFGDMTAKDRKEMSHAIEDGYVMQGMDKAGRPLAEIQQEAVDMFKEMAAIEEKAGFIDPKQILKNGYVPHLYKYRAFAKDRAAVDAFKAERKNLIQGQGVNTTATLSDAIKKGLKPEEHIDRIMMGKAAKHNAKLVQGIFRENIFKGYGQIFKGPVASAKAHGLVRINKYDTRMPKSIQAMLKKGETWYMPEHYFETLKNYDNLLSSWGEGTKAIGPALHYLDNVNRGFKMAKTVVKPGYHVNNLSGDLMMNYFDGVPSSEYIHTMNNWTKKLAGGRLGPTRDIKLNPHHSISHDALFGRYERAAGGSNFMSTDIGLPKGGPVGHGSHIVSSVNRGLRNVSEGREQFPRFTHFQHAVKQEFKGLVGDRKLSATEYYQKLNQAVENAVRRVDKFNVNYNAKTKFEQDIMSRVIPFYTYMRRATPTIMQAAAFTPGRVLMLDKAKKAIEDAIGLEPSPIDGEANIPPYLKEAIQTSGGPTPNFVNLQSLPQGQLQNVVGGSTFGDFLNHQLANLNPGIRIWPEYAQKKQYFNQQKINQGLAGYAAQELTPLQEIMNLGKIGAPGSTMQERLKGVGLPYYKVSENAQVAALKAQQDPYQQKITKLNALLKSKGYELSKSGNKWRIIDRTHGRLYGMYSTPEAAQAAANKL